MFDLWRSGFVRRSLSSVAATHGVDAAEITWIPCRGPFRFVADPFGIECDGVLTVFVEAFDYRSRRGEIHFYQYDAANVLIGQGPALIENFHLSYPSIIEDGGELYMLPEGYKSGGLTLYRCLHFPDQWEPVTRLLDVPAIDATVVKHGDSWWMFYALPGPDDRAMRELHVAHAETLLGPWTLHVANPVRRGFASSRPGGTAFVHDGALHLPLQDCDGAYGRAVHLLRLDQLTPYAVEGSIVGSFGPVGLLADYEDGFHTLSGMGDVTFVDVKRICRSASEGWVRTQFKVRRLLGLNRPRGLQSRSGSTRPTSVKAFRAPKAVDAQLRSGR